MGLEAATYISQLVTTNPVGAVDTKAQGDDHIRMLKAVLQANFPNLGAAAITATAAQINTVIGSGITGFANPTASTGLAVVNGAALTAMRSDAAPAISQAIAPTWTGQHVFAAASAPKMTSTGGSEAIKLGGAGHANSAPFLGGYSITNVRLGYMQFGVANDIIIENEVANGSINLVTPGTGRLRNNNNHVPNVSQDATWTGSHIFSKTAAGVLPGAPAITLSSGLPLVSFNCTGAAVDNRLWTFRASSDGTFTADTYPDSGGVGGQTWLQVDRTLGVVDSVNFPAGVLQYAGVEVGTRIVPRVTSGLVHGSCFATAAGMTLNAADMAAGRTFSIYNDSAANITLTQGGGVTLRLNGTATTGNRTILARGMATVWCNSGTEAVVSGAVA